MADPTQTLKKWLHKQPRARTLAELQDQLDTYRHFYNHDRPHRALGGATPAERFHATPARQPAGTPLELPTPTKLDIQQRVVDRNGRITVHSTSITVGRRHRGQTLTALTYGNRILILTGPTPLRVITTEPGRRDYPLLSPMS